jgi:hypothetical protein
MARLRRMAARTASYSDPPAEQRPSRMPLRVGGRRGRDKRPTRPQVGRTDAPPCLGFRSDRTHRLAREAHASGPRALGWRAVGRFRTPQACSPSGLPSWGTMAGVENVGSQFHSLRHAHRVKHSPPLASSQFGRTRWVTWRTPSTIRCSDAGLESHSLLPLQHCTKSKDKFRKAETKRRQGEGGAVKKALR